MFILLFGYTIDSKTLKALFDVMLREFGVKGVKVQEVVSLDDEMMAFLKLVLTRKNQSRSIMAY